MNPKGSPPGREVAWALRPIRTMIRAWRRAKVMVRLGRRGSFGSNVIIGPSSAFRPPDFVRIGDDVGIGAEFYCETNLEVGSGVLISSRVAMVGRDHRFDDPDQTVFWAGRLPPVTITLEGDNLIGFGTIIIGPATIGRGCIVGAGAVVTGDLPANTICVGAPARPIRMRFPGRPG